MTLPTICNCRVGPPWAAPLPCPGSEPRPHETAVTKHSSNGLMMSPQLAYEHQLLALADALTWTWFLRNSSTREFASSLPSLDVIFTSGQKECPTENRICSDELQLSF